MNRAQDIRQHLPHPACPLGYTQAQIQRILKTPLRVIDFKHWMTGQTMAICDGTALRPCVESHGSIVYRHDLESYLVGRPVLD